MPNEVNIYSPRYLAEVVKQAPATHTYFRDTFFTNIKTFSTERVDIDLVKGDRRMAAFVHPRVGGKVLAMKGSAAREELEESRNAIKRLGLKLEEVHEFQIDGASHSVIVLKKVAPTPPQYPRRYAKIKQAPL